jgi:NAD(P)-dependent dehydrogenase (short-subunit alcohol dehydrogenase family)
MMLHEKIVMITGASKGLGKELALQFAREGAKLAVCARNQGPLREVEMEIHALRASINY